MEENYFALLDELIKKYSFKEYGQYKDLTSYGNLFYYSFTKGILSIILYPEGKPANHIELIKSIVNDLIKILPKGYEYKLSIDGWYCEVKNGDLVVNFIDGKYNIENDPQEMHEKKEIATIMDVAKLNNISFTEFKWNVLKKKSIELGFTPVKEKNGIENLYLIEAFKVCYPEYNYDFFQKNEKPIYEQKIEQFNTAKIIYSISAILIIVFLVFIYYKNS